MSSTYLNTGQRLGGLSTDAPFPDHGTRNEFLTIGSTECYDLSRSAARGVVFDQFDHCHPHIVRIVGSLPGNEVVSAVKQQLISTFRDVDVGAVLIGANETIRANSNGERIESIPGIAVPLQSLAYPNSLYGNVMQVYGTLPIGKNSIVGEDSLDILGPSEPDMQVCMQRGLHRGLIFPTFKENVWMAEAEGVVQTVEAFLHQNSNARYTVILAGGGKATEHEYRETQSILAAEFGDRVQIITLAESGGFSSRLAHRAQGANISAIDFSARSLSEKLQQFNDQIPKSERFQEQRAAIEEQLRIIVQSRLRLSASINGENYPRSHFEREVNEGLESVWSRNLLERLVRLADQSNMRPGLIQSPEDLNFRQFSSFSRFSGDVIAWKMKAAFFGGASQSQTEIAQVLLGAAADIFNSSLIQSERTPVMIERRSARTDSNQEISQRLFLGKDPIPDIQVGNIISKSGVTLAVAHDEFNQRCLVGADGSIYPIQVIDEPVTVKGNLSNQIFSNHPLKQVSENIPTWSGLERHGGIIRYKDIHGTVVGHREILKVEQAKAEDGQIAKSVHRLITALDVTYSPPDVRVVRDIEHVNSLMFAPAHFSEAYFVEVFPFIGTAKAKSELPQQHIDRSMPHRLSNLYGPIHEITSKFEEALIQKGIDSAVNRIQSLSAESSGEAIKCLTGNDPIFEHSLWKQRDLATSFREFKQLVTSFIETFGRESPQMLERIGRGIVFGAAGPEPTDRILEKFLKQLFEVASDSKSATAEVLYSAIRKEGMALISTLLSVPKDPTGRYVAIRRSQRTVSPELAEICGEIARQVVIDFASGNPEEFRKLRSVGGSTTQRFTAQYFLDSVSAGARLIELYDTQSQMLVGFNLYFPAEAISAAQKENNPLLRNPGYGFYDFVCMRPGGSAPPTGSLMAIRAALVDLQHSDTDFLAATIHQLNEASMKSALRDRFSPASALEAPIFAKQVGNGFESRINTWKCPVSPSMRSALEPIQIDDRRERMALISRLKGEAGGFLNATVEERRQMQWMVDTNPDSAFIRMSVGVASMTESAKADLQYLIDQGTFSSTPAIFCLASNREANLSDAGWIFMERGPHEVMQRLKGNLHQDSKVIGIGTTDSRDANFGKSIEVLLSDGSRQSFPVAYTETDDGSKVTVLDRREFPVLNSPITFPQDYSGNLSIFHIEQLRAQEFAEFFKSSAALFIGGGGVNAWYIKELTAKVAQSPDSKTKVVLLKGFGGTTDKLADDVTWIAQYQQLIDDGRLVIINPLESEEQRLRLQSLLEQVAANAKS